MKVYFGVDAIIVSILCCSISELLPNLMMVPTIQRFLLKIGFVRILDITISLGSLVWLFSPAWDAFKLILQHAARRLASSVLSWS